MTTMSTAMMPRAMAILMTIMIDTVFDYDADADADDGDCENDPLNFCIRHITMHFPVSRMKEPTLKKEASAANMFQYKHATLTPKLAR